MVPYCVLIFAPLLPLALPMKKLNKQLVSIISFFSILLLLLVLRSEAVGRDLTNYEFMFRYYSGMSWSNLFHVHTEIGYVLMNKIVGLITHDFRWILVINAVLSLVPVAVLYSIEIENAALTIALFVTSSNFILLFSGLRQSIAISLGMIAFLFVRKHNIPLFVLFAVLAFLFHRSAFMLVFMYPIYNLKYKKVWLLWLIPLTGLIMIFNKQIFSLLLNFISDIYQGTMTSTGAYMMLILVVLFTVVALVIPDEQLMDPDTRGMRNYLILAVLVQVFASLNPMAMRMNYYYLIFVPLVIPRVLSRTSVRFRQIALLVKYILLIFFFIYFFVGTARTNSLDIFPYRFFWEKVY